MTENISRSQIVESIFKNGCEETIGMIARTPSDIRPQCAGDFLFSYNYVLMAKMIRFIRQEDGTFIKVT